MANIHILIHLRNMIYNYKLIYLYSTNGEQTGKEKILRLVCEKKKNIIPNSVFSNILFEIQLRTMAFLYCIKLPLPKIYQRVRDPPRKPLIVDIISHQSSRKVYDAEYCIIKSSGRGQLTMLMKVVFEGISIFLEGT